MQERFIETFLSASDTGNFKPLLAFLLDDVKLVSDGGGKVRAALHPIIGIERVRAFFQGLFDKGRFRNGFKPVFINGQPGLFVKRKAKPSWPYARNGNRMVPVSGVYIWFRIRRNCRGLIKAAREHSC